ncbi:MAG: hypothetical protein RQ856_06470, partial [Candidatus Izemoplasmatales bacterium]|nr:hypothetical protein [Candidatus Izemoplasmatales bacterium]
PAHPPMSMQCDILIIVPTPAIIKFFTGNCDRDFFCRGRQSFETMLTGGAGSIPIESEGFLYPADARFMSSDPTREGKTTFLYHFGVGIAAGADLTYSLKLVCTTGVDCEESYGFDGGKCDCFHGGEELTKTITGNVGDGNLNGGEFLDEEVYFMAPNEPVRYDKAILEIKYKDNDGQQQTKTVERKVTLNGDKPPADCVFDLIAGQFRCSFLVDERGYAKFTEEPYIDGMKPGDDGAYDYLVVKQNIELVYNVEKVSPGYEPGNQETTYTQIPKGICYSLSNQYGTFLVQETCVPMFEDGVYPSQSGGSKLFRIPSKNSEYYQISMNDFGKRSTIVPQAGEIYPSIITGARTASASPVTGQFKLTFSGNKAQICNRDTSSNCVSGTTKGDYQISNNEIDITHLGVILSIKSDLVESSLNGKSFTFDIVPPSNIQQDCENPEKAGRWRLNVKLVHANEDKTLRPSDPVNYNGQQQQRAIEFKVLCTETRNADGSTGNQAANLNCPESTTEPVPYDCVCGAGYCSPPNYCGTKDGVKICVADKNVFSPETDNLVPN